MSEFSNPGSFRDAVAIRTMRIFDSCSDKDCLEDLPVTFSDPCAVQAVNSAANAKCRCVEVVNATFGIDQIPYNCGFFAVDITYTFAVDIDLYNCTNTVATTVSGYACFNKKVILFGSETTAKTFSSDTEADTTRRGCCDNATLPVASVSVVDPIALDTKLVCRKKPHNGCYKEDGDLAVMQGPGGVEKAVLVTIGMFSIVEMSRPVSLLVPTYEYSVPGKSCTDSATDTPCELFEKICFPTDEFFPKSLSASDCNC
ncbi:MAG: hypothetical protein QM689_09110 [Oscillospiraceae bacterium]